MEVLFEQYLDKLNYNRYTTSFFIEKDSVFIFFGDYKVSTITDDLDKLNLKFSKIKYYFAPFLHTSVKGITINTKSLYPDILKKVEEKKVPIKVLKTLPQKLNSSIIVDLFPLLNKLSLLFEKRKLDKFDIYFKIVKDYNEKFSKYSAPIYNILYINPKKTSEEFLFDLHTYLKRKNFELDVNINNLYFAILDEKNVIYGKLGEYDSKEEVLKINYFSFKRLLYIYKKTKEKFDKKETDFTKTLDIEKLVNVIVKKYNINKKDVKENLKIILKEYISKNPKELQSASLDIEEIFSRALNEIAGVDINLKNLSEKDKKNLLEKIGSAFVRSTEIAPKLSEDYEKIYSPDKLLKVSSTVIDRHKREFDEILDTYIYKIFKTFEQGEYPLKLLSMDKKIKDNNVNRVIEYSFTFEDIHKNKHEVKVNIPAVINDRYFKLNGKYYILTNQLFLRPITKSKHNSVRFLSNYATLTIELKNTKIPISDINALLNYVVNKYSKHILLAVENELNEQIDPNFPPIKYSQIVFDTNDVFYGFNPIGNGEFILFQKLDENGDVVYEDIYDSNEKKIYRYFVKTGEKKEFPYKLAEFIANRILQIIRKFNPNETLAKTKEGIPYLQIRVAGVKLPLILFLISFLGFTNTLEKLGIKYSVSDKVDSDSYLSIKFKDKVLNIYVQNERQRYIVNGLKVVKVKFDDISFEEYETNEGLRFKFIEEKYGVAAARNFKLIKENIVDTLTSELLEYEGKSTDIFDILCFDMIDVLFNEEPKSPVDLRYARARLSEIMLNVLYKQMAMAKNDYNIRSSVDKTAKLYIDPDYVIKQILQGESTLQYIEPLNPIDELNTATRITPKGIGGVPSASLTLEHRLIPWHKDEYGRLTTSYYGNISALDTNEYGNVGINQELTLQSLVSDKFGLFGLRHNINDLKFETLGIGEALAPWIHSIDHDRVIKMAQQMRQTLPFENPSIPIVQSGMESLIPQMASKRFVIKAKKDGIIKEIKEDEYIVVEYDDGTKELFDIKPRLARTKRGLFIHLNMKVNVKEGQKVKKNQILASTSQFKDGLYSYGKNVVVALMPYNGGTYEDGWAVSRDTLEKFKYKELKEVVVLLPENAAVDQFVSEKNKHVKKGDVLISFTYDKHSLDDYLNDYNLNDLQDEDKSELNEDEKESLKDIYSFEDNMIKVFSPIDGKLKEIRIYLNSKNVDKKILSVWEKNAKELKKFVKKCEKINGKKDLSYLDNIDLSVLKVGMHKHKGRPFDGAKIVFFIEVEKTPDYGSKFVARGGAKGTVTYVFPEDKKPIVLDTKLKIDWIFNSLSIIGRKNANTLLELGVGKVLYFLNKRAKEMANDSKIKTKDIKSLVLDVYNALDQTKDKKVFNLIKENLANIPDKDFREMCKNIDELDRPLFVWYAIPFSKMDIKWIKDACEILNIPLEEYVYFPEIDLKTDKKVTVGVMYMCLLEHEPDSMIGLRSTGKYQVLTGQGLKGESRNVLSGKGAIRVDELTVAGLIDYFGKDSSVVKELFTVQSDDWVAKQDVMYQIIQNGAPSQNYKRGKTKTKELISILFKGMGLDPGF